MRKMLILLIGVITFFALECSVSAVDITFEDVANKYKEKFDFNAVDSILGSMYQELENEAVVIVSNDSILITYDDGEENYKTTFNYNDGIITYKYPGSKDINDVNMGMTMIDNAFITKLVYVILGIKGYSVEEITTVFGNIDEQSFKLETDGIEFTMFTSEYNDDNNHISISAIDTMKLDINKYGANKNIEDNSNNLNNDVIDSSNKNDSINDVENPHTGAHSLIVSVLLLLASLIFIRFRSSKNFISKI